MKKENTDDKENAKSTLRVTLSIISKILILAIIIALVIILVRVVVLKKHDVFGYRFYIIMSGSMEPTINVGDAVITKELDRNLQEEDIIAFQKSGSITVHRIVEIYTENEKTLYRTKGDNNNTIDAEKIELSEIKGKVVYTIPKVGNVILFLKSHVIIFVYILAFIIIIILVRRLI